MRRSLDNVLKILKQRQEEYVSGEEISRRLGVSRVAVYKQILKLRERGYIIEASPKMGYKLIQIPDKLYPWEIKARLQTRRLGREIIYFESISSTQEAAKELLKSGCEEGVLVVAEEQLAGRGRMGRNWFSPRGGLWCSVVLRPRIPTSRVLTLSLTAATAMALALRNQVGGDIKVKWPNDLLLEGKKLGGVLVEVEAEADIVKVAVLGIGVNLNFEEKELPEMLRRKATTVLSALGVKVDRAELLACYLGELERLYEELLSLKGMLPEMVVKELKWMEGRRAKFKDDVEREGVVLEVEASGALMVKIDEKGVMKMLGGDLEVLS